jgi:hypothetical protein
MPKCIKDEVVGVTAFAAGVTEVAEVDMGGGSGTLNYR